MSLGIRTGCVALAAAALAGCGGDQAATTTGTHGSPDGSSGPSLACTEIGCSSGLQLDLSAIAKRMPGATRVSVCLDDHCKSFAPRDSLALLTEPRIGLKPDVRVTMTVLGRGGRTLMRDMLTARIVRAQPNGKNCKPICFQVPLAIDPHSLKLRRLP